MKKEYAQFPKSEEGGQKNVRNCFKFKEKEITLFKARSRSFQSVTTLPVFAVLTFQ